MFRRQFPAWGCPLYLLIPNWLPDPGTVEALFMGSRLASDQLAEGVKVDLKVKAKTGHNIDMYYSEHFISAENAPMCIKS